MRRFSVLFLAVVLCTSTLQAGWSRAKLFGADVRALVVHPKKPDVLYLGTSQGELYVSHDGAESWTSPRSGIPFPGYVVDNLVVDERGRLWAAAWGLWGGGVIAMSTDDGVTWSRRDAGLEEFSVRAIALHPSDPDVVVVGGLDGVHLSHDSGKSWKKISDQVNVESLAFDPRNTDSIYVGTWRQAWRTDDAGKSWKHIEKGMVLDTDVFAIHINPKDPDNIWVATCGWVYNSKDRGDSWTRYREGFNNRRIHDVDIDPMNPSIVYAASVAGLYRSDDAGLNFKPVSDESMVINAIALHPDRPDRIILGTEGDGVYVSEDRGTTFARSNSGLYNVRVASVVSDPDIRQKLYAVVLFGGAASGIYESVDGGEDWSRLSRTKLPEILSLVVQKDSEPRFVAGTEKGFFWSSDGVEWTQSEPSTFPIRVERVVQFTSSRLFAATAEGVFTSKDAGKSWYSLAAFRERTIDIALGHLGKKRALYAMTANSGLVVFDGEQWVRISGAPDKGKQLAVRDGGDFELVVVGGGQGIRAGRIDGSAVWHPVDVKDERFAEVYQTTSRDLVVLASRESRDLMLSESKGNAWRRVQSPVEPAAILNVSVDSFDRETLYFGTRGQGIFIYRERPLKAPLRAAGTQSVAGSK